jgi:hypothetical protein
MNPPRDPLRGLISGRNHKIGNGLLRTWARKCCGTKHRSQALYGKGNERGCSGKYIFGKCASERQGAEADRRENKCENFLCQQKFLTTFVQHGLTLKDIWESVALFKDLAVPRRKMD